MHVIPMSTIKDDIFKQLDLNKSKMIVIPVEKIAKKQSEGVYFC